MMLFKSPISVGQALGIRASDSSHRTIHAHRQHSFTKRLYGKEMELQTIRHKYLIHAVTLPDREGNCKNKSKDIESSGQKETNIRAASYQSDNHDANGLKARPYAGKSNTEAHLYFFNFCTM
uniref:Uncharacterized protein n=1 Tax=Pristionchus pacificus TaxID=54126 RepID=A0A2A6BWI3_PRIPA|eukprot:PDM70362.1 hypothetical protein PRIPAC_46608 [Pristionchus pacificus]